MAAPIVHPDEAAYLGAAHHLAHGGGLPIVDAAYSPGWSLLLAPASWILDDPMATYRAALVLNVVLAGLTFWWAEQLVRRLGPGLGTRTPSLVAAATCLAPTFVLGAAVANTSTLVLATTVGLLVAVVRAWETGRARWWTLVGVGAGAATAVHPMTLALGAASVVALGLQHVGLGAHGRRGAGRRAGAFVVGLLPALWASALIIGAVRAASPPTVAGMGQGVTGPTTRLDQTAAQATDTIVRVPARIVLGALSGQTLSVVAATGGLAVWGAVAAVTAAGRLRSPATSPVPDARAPGVIDPAAIADRLRVLVAVVAGLTMCGSVLVINPGDGAPVQQLLFSRYVDNAAFVLLLVGLTAATTVGTEGHDGRERRANWGWAAGSTVVAAAAGATLLWTRVGFTTRPLGERQDILGLYVPFEVLLRLGTNGIGRVTTALVVGTGVVATFVAWTRRRAPDGPPAAVALTVLVTSLVGTSLLVDGSTRRADQHRLAGVVVAALADEDQGHRCIGITPDVRSAWHVFDLQFRLPDRRFVVVDDTSVDPCVAVVVADPRRRLLAGNDLTLLGIERTGNDTPIAALKVAR